MGKAVTAKTVKADKREFASSNNECVYSDWKCHAAKEVVLCVSYV